MKNLLLAFLFAPLFSLAQKPVLLVQGNTPNLFLLHTTAPKESFYSIGRLYNISPKEIAPYNKLTMENGLSIGQVIKIPLSPVNFSQVAKVSKEEAIIPLYYHAEGAETIAHISATHNKLPVASIKKWNKLTAENVPAGSNVMVGYLKVNKALSDFSNGKTYKLAASPDVVPHALDQPLEPVVTETKATEVVVQPVPVVTKTEPATATQTEVVKPVTTAETPVATAVMPVNNGGFFQASFVDISPGLKSGSGNVFKSTSGWDDQKYYCLFNNATPGSVVKITVNDRSVFAKVLDALPEMKQTQNLVISMSSAAAATLGIQSDVYEAVVSY